MSLCYVDTSALVRAYLADEQEHRDLERRILHGTDTVVTSELAWIELASAVAAASRHRRLRQAQLVLDRFAADCADDDGPLSLLRLDAGTAFPLAHRLVGEHHLRTLDAVHLAVALTEGVDLAAGGEITMLTRVAAQAAAARARGLATA